MKNLKPLLKQFFRTWELTWSFYVDMEEKVNDTLDETFNLNQQEWSIPEPDVLEEFREISNRYISLLREGLLIQICAFIEYTLGETAKLLVSDYESKLAQRKKGNWLEKNLHLLKYTEVAEVKTEDFICFCDFITLRNTFVHSAGNVQNSRSPAKVEYTIDRLQKIGKSQNSYIVKKLKTGEVILGPDALSEIVIRGEEIIRAIFKYGLELQTEINN